jgi:hypothetical protein
MNLRVRYMRIARWPIVAGEKTWVFPLDYHPPWMTSQGALLTDRVRLIDVGTGNFVTHDSVLFICAGKCSMPPLGKIEVLDWGET